MAELYKPEESKKGWYCTRPWKVLDVYAVNVENGQNGLFVYPCSARYVKMPIGDLLTESIAEIYKSTVLQNLRRSILDGSYKYCDLGKCIQFANKNKLDLMEFYDEKKKESLNEDYFESPEFIKLSYDYHCNIRCVTCRDSYIIKCKRTTKRT
jgi:hypothetical protein